MTYERMGDGPLDYAPCNYLGSKLMFRGPQRRLKGNYAAFLGATETYGKFIADPFPALIEAQTGVKCVNFGLPNAGVDAFLHDPGVLRAANRAQVTVLQVPCTQNMSNRYYTVHPRRNDRFLEASGLMRAVFPEVDFTEFHFTRHLVGRLMTLSPERFDLVRQELENAWTARMKQLLALIDSPVVLLWFSPRKPEESNTEAGVAGDPNFVTRDMVEALRPLVLQVAEVAASDAALSEGTDGMVFSELESQAAAELMGPLAHREAAKNLDPIISALADPKKRPAH